MIEIIVGSVAGCVFLAVTALVVARCYVRVPAGHALLITTGGREPRVTFTGAFVPPLIGRGELLDCSHKKIVVTREGRSGYRCSDTIRVAVTAEFHVRVNRTQDDVQKVAFTLGAARTGEEETARSLFHGKFDEALATVIAHFTLDDLTTKRDDLKDKVIEVVGRDMNGYILDDASIVRIDQVPIEMLDPDNVHDAEAITKITERTGAEALRAAELRLQSKREILAIELASRELTLETMKACK